MVVHSHCCITITTTIHLQNSLHLKKLKLLNNNPPSCDPFPLAVGNHHSIFCLSELAGLGTSYKWNCTVSVLLQQAYFT